MGSFRLFRSKTIAPGVRVNLTKSGVGLSVGSKFFRVSQHSTGSSTRSVSVPGTGFQWRDQRKHRPASSTRARPTRRSASPASTTQEAASTHTSTTAMLRANANVNAIDPTVRAIHTAAANGDMWQAIGLFQQLPDDNPARQSALVAALLLAVELHQPQLVARHINDHPPPYDLDTATFVAGAVAVPLTPGINVVMPSDMAVVYASVYALNRSGFYAQVTALYTSEDPNDDLAALFAVELARAFNGLGRFATAKETLAPVIRRTRFDRTIRCAALEQRCVANMGLKDRTAAKRDVDRLADLAPTFPTIGRLTQLVG